MVVWKHERPAVAALDFHLVAAQDRILVLPDTALRRDAAGVIRQVAAHAGLSPDLPPRRRAACGAACTGADAAAPPLDWAALT